MSEYIFKLPDLGEGTVESEIAEWFIAVGDQVNEEDVVGTMMTDKAAVELSSRYILTFVTSGVGLVKWRTIEVTVEGYRATTRSGYMGTLP